MRLGVSEIANCGWTFAASFQVVSVTRHASSIASERSQPGVIEADGDPAAARFVDERRGLLDRLGTVVALVEDDARLLASPEVVLGFGPLRLDATDRLHLDLHRRSP